MTEQVKVTREGSVAVVLLDRPDAYNAQSPEMLGALVPHLMTLGSDESVRGVVITGAGKAFCAGGDLKWALSHPQGAPAAFHQLAGSFHLAITEIRRMRKPVIAALNGVAAGGGFSLALACDFRVMARSAVLRQAYTSSGLCIDGSGTFTLPRLVGLARALEIAAFDQPIGAEQALAWGLVTRIVDDGTARDAAAAMAHELARTSVNSFGWVKQLFTDSFDTALETQIERERAGLSACAAHAEGREGLEAFTAKRKPRFGT